MRTFKITYVASAYGLDHTYVGQHGLDTFISE